ncbi:glycosyl hydrolase family 18 protein [Paenibacillus sp. UNC499MF]|uniref:glycosyl hydrolase family 18 protein n=1 Tax=Paenibacillus sp. UNC499MF TaxID=1502751 RepID=UPI002156468A|nr:glycosyl hydrolase family 18 protein [Paenibacillus sp. UNC499MF]
MKQPYMSGSKRKKSRLRSFILLLIVLAAIAYLVMTRLPNNNHITPFYANLDKPVFYQGEAYEGGSALGAKGAMKLPLGLVSEWIDPAVIGEASTNSVILTTEQAVVRLQTDKASASRNLKEIPLASPMIRQGKEFYVPVSILKDLYGIEVREDAETGAVSLFKPGEKVRWGTFRGKEGGELRSGSSVRSPITGSLADGEHLMIWGEQNGWYKVQLPGGRAGYVKTSLVTEEKGEEIPSFQPPAAKPRWKPEGKLNMTWEHVVTATPKTASIPEMPGLNVVSPTWFHLADEKGSIKNQADPAYIKWAHSRNYQIWALFDNSFEPNMTGKALGSYETRLNMISQLLSFTKQYNLQGINIDFENMNKSDGPHLVQFVREMAPLLHEQGLVLSIDVTAKSGSDAWSRVYNRPALAAAVDYMMLMAYDEHWASSPKSGSVASLPWVERSLKQILDEDKVPPSKLVLGIPFYTRIWTEEQKDEGIKVSSKAVFMEKPRKIIQEKGLTPQFREDTGQNYVEYKEDGKLNRIWLEDETSVKARLEIVSKYKLAGVASWRRGFEEPAIWQVIADALQSK